MLFFRESFTKSTILGMTMNSGGKDGKVFCRGKLHISKLHIVTKQYIHFRNSKSAVKAHRSTNICSK